MLITINGIPGVGKSAACKWLATQNRDISIRETNLGTVVRRHVSQRLNPFSPSGFLEWQRGFLLAVQDELYGCPSGLCLLENGLEQIVGYSGAIAKLRSREDPSWLDSWRILQQEYAPLRKSLGLLTIVLVADIRIIESRRRIRQFEPDYLGLRESEDKLQSAFLSVIRNFAPNVEVVDTTSSDIPQVAQQIAGLITRLVGYDILGKNSG